MHPPRMDVPLTWPRAHTSGPLFLAQPACRWSTAQHWLLPAAHRLRWPVDPAGACALGRYPASMLLVWLFSANDAKRRHRDRGGQCRCHSHNHKPDSCTRSHNRSRKPDSCTRSHNRSRKPDSCTRCHSHKPDSCTRSHNHSRNPGSRRAIAESW